MVLGWGYWVRFWRGFIRLAMAFLFLFFDSFFDSPSYMWPAFHSKLIHGTTFVLVDIV
jgi:hypothetical protein